MAECVQEDSGAQTLGLSTEEVRGLELQGKTNAIGDEASGVASIVARNVFTYFNAIFLVLAILLVMAGQYKSMTFVVPVVANTVIGILQQLRSKRVLDDLALLDVSEYQAIRGGQEQMVASEALVLGDCVRLVAGQQVPADAVVVAGEGAVNESLLTGEPDEVEKAEGADLLSGSFVVSGNLTARLTHVGADSYAAHLQTEARQVTERKSEMILGVERIIAVAGAVVLPIGVIMLWQKMQQGIPFPNAVQQMVAAVIGMIPEGLYLLVTVALALSAMRLARRKVLLHDMRSIETLARVDVLCADKTGTITTDAMCVDEVFGPKGNSEADLADEVAILASYVATVNDDNQTMRALVERFGGGEAFEAESITPFSSRTKHSEVISGDITYLLGAPQFVLAEAELAQVSSEIEQRTRAGRRVLCLACREEQDGMARPLVFVSLKNEVRPDARTTFAYFAEQGVEVRVISGDDPLTVSAVAREAGIAGAERYVDATTLDTPEKLWQAAADCIVFGRVKPEQKRELVEALHAQGHQVAMTGDGVNDILAMKEADCSIAMGTGSDAARQAAQVVLLDSDFSHMVEIVGEGRRDINNITRSATLFLYKNIFSLSLALFTILCAFPYPLSVNQVSLISFFNIGLPAFLLAFEPNEARQEGRFLREVVLRSLPAALTSFVTIAYLMRFAELFGISATDVATSSTYLLSVVGYLILIAITTPQNRYRVAVIALCVVGFIACGNLMHNLFDITRLSARALALVVVFAVAEVGVLDTLGLVLQGVRMRLLLLKAKGQTETGV